MDSIKKIVFGVSLLVLGACATPSTEVLAPVDCDKTPVQPILPTDSAEVQWEKLQHNTNLMRVCNPGLF